MSSTRLLDSLIEFIVRYEYARALFDKRAAVKFAAHEQAANLFESLATTELNHAHRLQTFLNQSVVPGRKTFFEHPEYGDYGGQRIDGLSKSKWWTRFLFQGKSASDWGLEDTLTFCAAAERLESWGYKVLGLIPKFHKTALVISHEEENAEARLRDFLEKQVGKEQANKLIRNWYLRAFVSMLILVFTGNR